MKAKEIIIGAYYQRANRVFKIIDTKEDILGKIVNYQIYDNNGKLTSWCNYSMPINIFADWVEQRVQPRKDKVKCTR